MNRIKKYLPAILYCTLLIVAVSLCIYIAETTDFTAGAAEQEFFSRENEEKTAKTNKYTKTPILSLLQAQYRDSQHADK